MQETGTTFKLVLAAVVALAWLGVLLAGKDRLRSGFVVFVCLLGLGYRTVHATEVIRITPAEVVLCLLPLFLAGRRGPAARGTPFPPWLLLLLPFWALAWFTSVGDAVAWDVQASEFRNFLLLIPLFAVAPVVLADRRGWRAVAVAFWAVGAVVAALGVFEYLMPGTARSLPGFVGNREALVADDGFVRAGFSFYGGPIAVFVCVLALPFTLYVWSVLPAWWQRLPVIAGTLVQLAGVYIAGWRSMWLLVGLQVLLVTVFRKRFGLAVALGVAAVAAFGFLPTTTRTRVASLVAVLQGKPRELDTSGHKRWDRAVEALKAVEQNPVGNGWGSAGWVHSDFLQVAANQGVLAGVIFLAGYVVTLVSLLRRVWATGARADDVGLPVCLAFLAAGGMLLFEGIEVLPQTILPVWLTWCMAHTWLRQTRNAVAGRPAGPTRVVFRRVRVPGRVLPRPSVAVAPVVSGIPAP